MSDIIIKVRDNHHSDSNINKLILMLLGCLTFLGAVVLYRNKTCMTLSTQLLIYKEYFSSKYTLKSTSQCFQNISLTTTLILLLSLLCLKTFISSLLPVNYVQASQPFLTTSLPSYPPPPRHLTSSPNTPQKNLTDLARTFSSAKVFPDSPLT